MAREEFVPVAHVYVSGASERELAFIRDALLGLHVLVQSGQGLSLHSLPEAGVPARLQRADLVLAALDASLNPGALIELGMALAVGKPIGIVGTGDAGLPTAFEAFPSVRLDTQHQSELVSLVERLLRHPSATRGKITQLLTPDHPIGGLADELVALLDQPEQSRYRESDLVDILARALRQTGADVATRVTDLQLGGGLVAPQLDMAVQSEGLRDIPANPLVVEIKGGPLDRAALQHGLQQAERYAQLVDAPAALLVYAGAHRQWRGAQFVNGRYLFWLPLRDLLEGLRDSSLSAMLLSLETQEAVPG